MKINRSRFGRLAFFAVTAMGALASSVWADEANNPLPPDVVARQGGVDVTLQDVDAAADKIPEGDRAGFFDSPKRIESTVGGLLFQKQLAAKARKAGVEKDPLVQREIAQATDDVLGRVQLDRYRKSLKMPDFSMLAKEYYVSHKDEFVEHGGPIVEHVLVATKNRSTEEAEARVGEVEAAARAHPDQFEDLVEKYSDDPRKAENHGRIANGASNKVAKPFAAAANALTKPGDISPVVKTDLGFHVIKLIEKKPDRQRPYEEVQTDLVLTLKRNFLATQLDQYSGELRGNPLQANPDLVASLRTRYAGSQGDATPPAKEGENSKADEQAPPSH